MSEDADAHDALAPFETEQLAPSEVEQLELFRRSPHPYHRRQHELQSNQASPEASSNDFSRTALGPSDRTISDQDGRKRRKISQSPSESGTEADDEGYGFVKALPAPPLRPRKGLRDVRGTGLDGVPSPLLTPSLVDEEGRRLSTDYFKLRKDGIRNREPSPTDDETKAAREKYLKRRRSELVRRVTETALLGFIGILAVRGCGCWERLRQWHRGSKIGLASTRELANRLSVELLTHVFVMAGVLGLYPLRLLLYSKKREPTSNLRLRHRIRIPAAFDPAPILYPAILPVLISISLYSSNENILLPNIILGLAALPPQLIPYGRAGVGFSSTHWVLSILPLFVSENTDMPSKLLASMPYKLKLPPPEKGLHPEVLVGLFALHQALLPPLHYLTTTSLLTAELHLLSIGLVNLLLFADSPQAVILKTLLWFGGVSLFVLCGKVLKWGVALARIPRWRFRRVGQVIKARQSFLKVLQTLKPRARSAGRTISDSDADEDGFLLNKPLKPIKSLKLNIASSINSSKAMNGDAVMSAIEPQHANFSEPGNDDSVPKSKRRNTLPNLPSPHHTSHQSPRNRNRSKSVAQSFLSLTPAQATLRKWIYAAYFYIVVLLVILGPIRHLIGKHALNDHEPFGWAISYLFGNIQPFRFQVFDWDLNSWVPLPPLLDSDSLPSSSLGLVEYYRTVVIGEANTRLDLCVYCLVVIAVGLIVVLSSAASVFEVDTRRKVFHGMMVAMLLPTIFIDPCFIALALSLILAIFLLLDLIRASQLPPLSKPIARFLTPYVDGRDLRGPVVVSHIFLLIGCAIPLWLSLAGVGRTAPLSNHPTTNTTETSDDPWASWEVNPQDRDVSMIAGVICVGMGDAAASLIGRRYGRRKWPWAGGKSLEGSAAFAVAVTIGLVAGKVYLRLGGWDGVDAAAGGEDDWDRLERLKNEVLTWTMVVLKAGICAMGASLNEAVLTGGNDNVVVPVVLWVLVRGVQL